MEKVKPEFEILQLGILHWASSTDNESEMKQLFSVLEKNIFGAYQNIAEWFMKEGPEQTTELFSYLSKNKLVKEYTEIINPEWFTTCVYSDAKKLCRIKLGNSLKSEDIVQVLKEFEELIEKIEELRVGSKLLKLTGQEVFGNLYEEVAEKNANADFDSLSGYTTGFKTLDEATDGMRKGTVTRLSAYANTGKSKFSYHLANNLLKQGAKVLYFSLEVNSREVALNLSANWFQLDYYTISKGRELPNFGDYPVKSIWIVDNIRSMSGIETIARKIKPDVVMIDFVQNIITEDRTEYERMTNVAVAIQNLAVSENIAIFDLSQVSNDGKDYHSGGVIPSKGSGALAHSADIALVLTRDAEMNSLSLHIAKNKFGRNNIEVEMMADYSKSTFNDLGIAAKKKKSKF